MNKIKQVIVIRKDLCMTKGKMIAQGAHASSVFLCEALRGELKLEPVQDEWIHGTFAKVCLYVESEEALSDLIKEAIGAGILTRKIIDSGLTMFKNVPTLTCAAFGPDYSERLDPITGDLKLL